MSSTFESAPSAAAAAHAEGTADAGDVEQVQQAYDRLKGAWRSQGGLDYKTRMKLLKDLMQWVRKNREDLITALMSDYGHRSPHETLMAEVFTVVDDIKHIRAHLAEWMAEQPRPVAATFKPGTARAIWQPLGVVGVIAPWNYPFQLGILPAVAAISAGCRVMLKPSEFSPAVGQIFRRIEKEVLPADVFAVVEGGVDVSAAFSRQPFDHLFFTGSTSVGRHVMRAASEHLTPVTLELGGKSPAIVHKDHSLAQACARIVAGKGFNAGQTCIAPDYVLVHESKKDALVAELQKQFAAQYPTVADNPDYTAVINQRHYDRLQAWLQDARDKGAKIIECNPAGETLDPGKRKLPLTIVLDAPDDAIVLQDEIFGPVLPIVTYSDLDQAIAYVNDRPRPLALYYFDWNKKRQDLVVQNTWSGGVTLNDTILHFSQLELPFGGVGPSGMGAYHGWYGFRTFSHEKGIFSQARVNGGKLITAPYGKVTDTLLKLMIG